MNEPVEVRVTTDSQEEAEKICTAVVAGRVAACAQITAPIRSTYWWEGKIETAVELMILMKTTSERLDELVEVVRANHSYDTPEIVAVPITGGLADYLTWITTETTPQGEAGGA